MITRGNRRTIGGLAAVAACALIGGLVVPAAAHDLLKPPFRGKPGSTHQSWDFNTPLLGAPDGPCPPQNAAGMPTATVSPGAMWLPQFAGQQGVWCFFGPGAAMNFMIPNGGGPPWYFKTIWIQMTLHFHSSAAGVSVDTPGGFSIGTVDLQIPGKGPNWVHRTVALCLFNCPPGEVITLTSTGLTPDDHVDISQIVIETFCDLKECHEPPLPVFPGDYDGDGIGDAWDNAPGQPNPNQSDCDGDGLGDPSDLCEICPPGTVPEPEPCGTDVNGGCNHPTGDVTTITCNTEICGDAWAENGVRDTDWYEITLPDPDGDGVEDLIVQVCTALPVAVYVFDASCPIPLFFSGGDADLDRPYEAVTCLAAPATYRIFVAPGTFANGIFDGYPCFGLYNQYWLRAYCAEPCFVCGVPGTQECCAASTTLSPGCEDADCCAKVCAIDSFCCQVRWDQLCANEARNLCPEICCTADLNGDGIVNGNDLGILLGYWGANFLTPADLDGNCFVNGADLGELLGQWGPC